MSIRFVIFVRIYYLEYLITKMYKYCQLLAWQIHFTVEEISYCSDYYVILK
jgi:hypothetical protein